MDSTSWLMPGSRDDAFSRIWKETTTEPAGALWMNEFAALDAGLPDCSGVALGIDRLLMCIAGARHIDQVLCFPSAGPDIR